jgi:hypothetical protein
MSGLSRVGAAARRGAARLMPAGRRDWVEAVWAEAREVPPGMRRLAWRAGGVRLMAREALMRRRAGSAMLFAAAAALVAWRTWPGSPGSYAASVGRVDVITIVVLLGGLPLVARRAFGPPGDSRVARFLRVGTYAAILALIPAKNVVEQVLDVPPRGGTGLRLYRLISGEGFGNQWSNEIVFLVVMALYAAAIVWMTSQRARVAPATLAIGTVAGTALGAAWYAIGPLGFGGGPATNPWLPGSDIAPFMVLAWILLFGAPVAAGVAADRCYTASGSSIRPAGARACQILAAGLLTNLAGALFVTVSGTATIAAMLKAAWLRNWLYHGQHLLFGVGGLRLLLRGDPGAVTYSHEITAAVDAPPFLIICMAFPLIALALTGWAALIMWGNAATGPGGPRRGGGGPPGPEPAPDPPDSAQLADITGDVGLAAGLLTLHEQGPGIEQDRLMAGLADATARRNLTAAQGDARKR